MFFRVVLSLSSDFKKCFFFLGIYITDGKSMLAFSNEASVGFVRRTNSINFYLHCKDCSYPVPRFVLCSCSRTDFFIRSVLRLLSYVM